MRTPLLIILEIIAIVAGLGLGALLGVVFIGLLIGVIGAAVIVLAGWGAGKAARAGANRS